MAEIPEELFERLLDARVHGTKALAQIALALRDGNRVADVERCPHCGAVIRIRGLVNDKAVKIINEWIMQQTSTAPSSEATK
jgi:hypothetical protein